MNELPDERQRLADWEALCAWLEERSYNASYRPRCQGEYLLSAGHITLPEQPDVARAINRQTRAITAERRRLQLVYWSTGLGWRLRKDYKEKLAAERKRIEEQAV
jgi:hypothetical protein